MLLTSTKWLTKTCTAYYTFSSVIDHKSTWSLQRLLRTLSLSDACKEKKLQKIKRAIWPICLQYCAKTRFVQSAPERKSSKKGNLRTFANFFLRTELKVSQKRCNLNTVTWMKWSSRSRHCSAMFPKVPYASFSISNRSDGHPFRFTIRGVRSTSVQHSIPTAASRYLFPPASRRSPRLCRAS